MFFIPVVAPWKGATPVGKLCVSAVKMICFVTPFRILTFEASCEFTGVKIDRSENPMIALELSLNFITLFALEKFCVAVTIWNNVWPNGFSFM